MYQTIQDQLTELDRLSDAALLGSENADILYFTDEYLLHFPATRSVRFLVEVVKEGQTRLLDCCVVSDGTPCKPKLLKLVEKLGEDWEVLDFWQPWDCDEF